MDERVCERCGGSGVELYDAKLSRFREALHRWAMTVCALGLLGIDVTAFVMRSMILWSGWIIAVVPILYAVFMWRDHLSATGDQK